MKKNMAIWFSESLHVRRLLLLSIWLFVFNAIGISLHYGIISAWGQRHLKLMEAFWIIYLIVFVLHAAGLIGLLIYYLVDRNRRKRFGYLFEYDSDNDVRATFDDMI